jgi:hypothetical protein
MRDDSAKPARLTASLAWLWGPLEDLPYYAFFLATMASAFAVRGWLDQPSRLELAFVADWLLTIAFIYGALRTLVLILVLKFRHGESLLDTSFWRRIQQQLFDPPRLLNFSLILLTIPALMGIFTIYKATIPHIIPFSWDVRFAAWDRWLHLGTDPWILLHPATRHPAVLWILDKAYALWFPVLWTTFIWQAWHGSREGTYRSQYLLAFAVCWILLGNVAATLLSSAGPVYYDLVTGQASPFAPLVEHLLRVDAETPFRLRALWAHDYLWRQYLDPEIGIGDGISAMPSLHISMVVLMGLIGFRVGRGWAWFYTGFGLLIFIGSVSLAWHYAIDAYVAAIGTIGIWWVSGKLVRRWHAIRRQATE